MRRQTTEQEMQDCIDARSCPTCKKVIIHTPEECMAQLYLRVKSLEETVETLVEKIDGIKISFK